MDTALLPSDLLPGLASPPPPVLDIVVPVHDEAAVLDASVRRLHAYLTASSPFSFRITVAENASSDDTLAVARRVAAELPGVEVLALRDPGRGRALRTAWLRSDAAVLAYMDVDLSTDLDALLPLVAPLVSGHSDLAVGSRLARSARVVRGPKREIVSRCYNLLLRATRTVSTSDAQCGFKAVRADVAERVLPLVVDDGWFFDTELLWLAERIGLRIHEVPVDWVDDPDSRVDILATARADLAGIVRVHRSSFTGSLPLADLRSRLGRPPLRTGGRRSLTQLASFAGIGSVSTAAYLLLFVALRAEVPVQVANLGALALTAVANTAANRRLTFGIRGRAGSVRAQLQGLLVFAAGLAVTSGSLAVLDAVTSRPTRPREVTVLVVAGVAATLLRFVLFRSWIFRRRRGPALVPAGPPPAAPVAS